MRTPLHACRSAGQRAILIRTPLLRLLKLANGTPCATTVSARSVLWAILARPFVPPMPTSPAYDTPETYAYTSLDSPTILSQPLPSTFPGPSNTSQQALALVSPASSQYTSPASSPAGSRPASSPASPSLSRSNSGSNVHAAVFVPSAFKSRPSLVRGNKRRQRRPQKPVSILALKLKAHRQLQVLPANIFLPTVPSRQSILSNLAPLLI